VGMGGFGLSKELHDARKILADASDPGLLPALRQSPALGRRTGSCGGTTVRVRGVVSPSSDKSPTWPA
jgi:hypothetical protein